MRSFSLFQIDDVDRYLRLYSCVCIGINIKWRWSSGAISFVILSVGESGRVLMSVTILKLKICYHSHPVSLENNPRHYIKQIDDLAV